MWRRLLAGAERSRFRVSSFDFRDSIPRLNRLWPTALTAWLSDQWNMVLSAQWLVTKILKSSCRERDIEWRTVSRQSEIDTASIKWSFHWRELSIVWLSDEQLRTSTVSILLWCCSAAVLLSSNPAVWVCLAFFVGVHWQLCSNAVSE